MPDADADPTPPSQGDAGEPKARAKRPPVPVVLAAAVLVVLVLASVTVARSSNGSVRRRPTTTTTLPQPVQFAFATIEPNGTAPPSPEAIAAVIAQLNAWATDGIVEPLRAGVESGPGVAALFTATAQAELAGAQRPTILLTGVPQSDVAITAATVALSSMAGPDAGVAVVVATVDLRLTATAKKHSVTIIRQGQIVLVPEADGVWRIDGWTLHASEQSA